jgi:hypothetical protein
MSKLVVVINGHPRSGKDTAVEFMMSALNDLDIFAWAMSSIDPVKELLLPVTDGSAKTEQDRKLWAVVGRAVEEHSSWRTSQVVQYAAGRFRDAGVSDAVVFVHMREPDLIAKLQGMLAQHMPEAGFMTIFVDKPDAKPVTSNAADAGVEDMTYNRCLFNAGTLDDLRRAAAVMAGELFLKAAA